MNYIWFIQRFLGILSTQIILHLSYILQYVLMAKGAYLSMLEMPNMDIYNGIWDQTSRLPLKLEEWTSQLLYNHNSHCLCTVTVIPQTWFQHNVLSHASRVFSISMVILLIDNKD